MTAKDQVAFEKKSRTSHDLCLVENERELPTYNMKCQTQKLDWEAKSHLQGA